MPLYELSVESWLDEAETDEDLKNRLRKLRNRRLAAIMRIFSLITTPLPGHAVPPPPPPVVEPDRQKRGGQGGSRETEFELVAIPEGVVMERLGHLAATTPRGADAEAYAGALPMLAAKLVPAAAPALIRAAPVMVGGISGAARILRKNQATRDLVRSLPNVAHRTALEVGHRAARGQAVSPSTCSRILANTAVRVLSKKAVPPELSKSQYDALSFRALRKLAKENREAAAALWDRYQKMPDVELRPYARRDAMARAVLIQRYPSNEEKLARIREGKDHRPPHSATVIRYRPNSAKPWRHQLTSGNATPEEKRLFPDSRERGLATHTEARAVRMANLKPGDFLSIMGQYDPCRFCRQAMQTAALRSGATIRYNWMGGTETFPQ
jgi:Pput_2613-like deaminase